MEKNLFNTDWYACIYYDMLHSATLPTDKGLVN